MIKRKFLYFLLLLLSGCQSLTLHGPTIRTFADQPKLKDIYVGLDVEINLDKLFPCDRVKTWEISPK